MLVSIDRAKVVCNKTLKRLFCGCFMRKNLPQSASRPVRPVFINLSTTINPSFYSRSNILSDIYFTILGKVERRLSLVALFLALLNSHYFFFLRLESPFDIEATLTGEINLTYPNISRDDMAKFGRLTFCFPNGDHHPYYFWFLSRAWIVVDLIFSSVLPGIVMSACSVTILLHIRRKSQGLLGNQFNQVGLDSHFRVLSLKRTMDNFCPHLIVHCPLSIVHCQ
jgi:hypothetical protein